MKKQRGGDPPKIDVNALANDAVKTISEAVQPQITAGYNFMYKKGEETAQNASLQKIADLKSAVSELNGNNQQLAAEKAKSDAEKEQFADVNKKLTAEKAQLIEKNAEVTTLLHNTIEKLEAAEAAKGTTLSNTASKGISAVASTASTASAAAANKASNFASNLFGRKSSQPQPSTTTP